MRVRPLLSAVLSVLSAILATPRRKAHALVVTVAVATVAVVTPILLADGSAAAEGTTTQPGQQASVAIPLGQTPPRGTVTIEVTVSAVPGESNTQNNTQSFPALFQ